jgi:hypothetical protein
VGEAVGLHPSMPTPRDRELACAIEFLWWVNTHVKGHIDAIAIGTFLSLTIDRAIALIEKMVSNQGEERKNKKACML